MEVQGPDARALIFFPGYFEIVSYSSTLWASHTRLIQNYEPAIGPLGEDRHPMVWAYGANKLEFNDTETVFTNPTNKTEGCFFTIQIKNQQFTLPGGATPSCVPSTPGAGQ